MNPHPGVEIAHRFFAGTGPTYDLVANLCTFGFDVLWKNEILRRIPRAPRRILDQACGTGILTSKIARRFPSCLVTGVELRDEYLGIARRKSSRLGLKNVDFILGRAEDIVLKEPVDCITSSYLAKYADLEIVVRNAKTMLRQGGLLIVHDFTYPRGRFFPRLWETYFKVLRTAGARCLPPWRRAFDELPGFLSATRWVPELLASLRDARFTRVCLESLTLGTSAIITATRP